MKASAFVLALLFLSACSRNNDGAQHFDAWEQTVERTADAVVVLRVTETREFDSERARSVQGTGFVVDAERGLILTNRHLTNMGPVVATAMFRNREEVDIVPVYRDPVHDFGFYRFDPADVRWTELTELELDPSVARVGLDIRVVGNDSGELLSVLDATIARLDRIAPRYGSSGYNDFNTFYFQAASGTSGGSSGSPVVDRRGRVVALNAGGRRNSASGYYLPLDRIVPALEVIRQGGVPPRGTLQTVHRFDTFDQLRRLGLSEETEREVREVRPAQLGLLVVSEVVAGGPAEGQLRPGDAIIRAAEVSFPLHVEIAELLDGAVGSQVEIEVERAGLRQTVLLSVLDMHAISPDEFVEFGGGVVTPMSFQQSRNRNLPARGLLVSASGFALAAAGISDAQLLLSYDGRPLDTLDDLWEALVATPDGTRVTMEYASLNRPAASIRASVLVDSRWFPVQRCVRVDDAPAWDCVEDADRERATPVSQLAPQWPKVDDPLARELAMSLVRVDFDVPHATESNVQASHYSGVGVIIDAELGRVLVDRNTVPVALGETSVVFGGSLRIPAQVELLHPTHNLAVVRFDPAVIEGTDLRAIRFADASPRVGARVRLVGIDRRDTIVVESNTVAAIGAPALAEPGVPRFRAEAVDVISLGVPSQTGGGVLVDGRGAVSAFYVTYHDDADGGRSRWYGIPVEALRLAVETMVEQAGYRSLGVRLGTISLLRARETGLPAEEITRIEASRSGHREVIVVRSRHANAPEDGLREGDMVLGVDGTPASSFLEVQRSSQHEEVIVRVFRGGEIIEVPVRTTVFSTHGTDRAVLFAGAVIHDLHPAAIIQRPGLPEGVYVSSTRRGSAATSHGLSSGRVIFEVNDTPTPNLDAFIEAVRNIGDRDAVRLRYETHEGRGEQVMTLRTDLSYWPTELLERGEDGWTRTAVGPL